MKKLLLVVSALAMISFAGCAPKESAADALAVDPANFESVIDGKDVHLYTVENDNGMIVQFTNYGARVVSIIVPDRKSVV